MFVKERFVLDYNVQDYLKSLIPPFGYNGYGEFIFYRTYSRVRHDGEQEDWADVVTRVTEGTFSIRKDWYIKNHIHWEQDYWQNYAKDFAISMYLMHWMPPGRGLWAMGSNFVFERGSMALNNCGYTDLTNENLGDDVAWLMDALMQGVGVGFGPNRDDSLKIYAPHGVEEYIIPDSREGWCEGTRKRINSYTKPGQKKVKLIYDLVRRAGLPIKGFGGISSGPEPLIEFHQKLEEEFENYKGDSVYLKTNIANRAGCCVVAGNVRRSAELSKGKITDETFINLKDYLRYPEREAYGWMSNNSVELEHDEDFEKLGEIAKRVIKNGEPGYINLRNFPYARIGKKMRGMRYDKARGLNPCGEIPLEHRELCNLAETYPTMCKGIDQWYQACEYATLYCSTVSLLPTQQPLTNRVVARNRRIGVGIVDYTGWKQENSVNQLIKWMRKGYKIVKATNKWVNEEAGIPLSIRLTTCKPGGTSPKLPSKTSGAGYPTFDYTLRRTRVSKNAPFHSLLVKAGIPYEQDYFDKYTDVFEYPILQGPAPPAYEVTIWEQAFNVITIQREWSDNAVSNTLYFKPKWPLIEHIDIDHQDRLAQYIGIVDACRVMLNEAIDEYLIPDRYKIRVKRNKEGEVVEIFVHEFDPRHEENDIEPVLSAIAPLTKTVSLLPHSPKGAYRQMPEEGITKEEYQRRLSKIKKIDWSKLSGSDGQDEMYCTTDRCELILR